MNASCYCWFVQAADQNSAIRSFFLSLVIVSSHRSDKYTPDTAPAARDGKVEKTLFTLFIPNISLLLPSVFSHLFPFSWPPKWLCSHCISFCHVPVPFLVFFPFSLEALILASLQDPLSSAEIQERLNNAMLAICRGLS